MNKHKTVIVDFDGMFFRFGPKRIFRGVTGVSYSDKTVMIQMENRRVTIPIVSVVMVTEKER